MQMTKYDFTKKSVTLGDIASAYADAIGINAVEFYYINDETKKELRTIAYDRLTGRRSDQKYPEVELIKMWNPNNYTGLLYKDLEDKIHFAESTPEKEVVEWELSLDHLTPADKKDFKKTAWYKKLKAK